MQHTRQWTIVARILRPQGRKGEVLAELLTDFPSRFADSPHVQLAPAGFAEAIPAPAKDALQSAEIVSHWLPAGRNAGRVVLHFSGVDTINAAETLAGMEVVVPLEERVPLDADAIYISDLEGCSVYDRDTLLGTVESVQFSATPNGSRRLDDVAPLLVVRSIEGDELLLPFVKDYQLEVNTAAQTIRMELPKGLADLNRGGGGGE